MDASLRLQIVEGFIGGVAKEFIEHALSSRTHADDVRSILRGGKPRIKKDNINPIVNLIFDEMIGGKLSPSQAKSAGDYFATQSKEKIAIVVGVGEKFNKEYGEAFKKLAATGTGKSGLPKGKYGDFFLPIKDVITKQREALKKKQEDKKKADK